LCHVLAFLKVTNAFATVDKKKEYFAKRFTAYAHVKTYQEAYDSAFVRTPSVATIQRAWRT
jgi:hypothetical protein